MFRQGMAKALAPLGTLLAKRGAAGALETVSPILAGNTPGLTALAAVAAGLPAGSNAVPAAAAPHHNPPCPPAFQAAKAAACLGLGFGDAPTATGPTWQTASHSSLETAPLNTLAYRGLASAGAGSAEQRRQLKQTDVGMIPLYHFVQVRVYLCIFWPESHSLRLHVHHPSMRAI